MTRRALPRLAVDFDEVRALGLRPSIKIAKAAAVIDVDISTIYRLIKKGALNAHKVGSEYRIYVDSLRTYQADGESYICTPEPEKAPSRSRHSHLPVAHHEAMAYLERMLM